MLKVSVILLVGIIALISAAPRHPRRIIQKVDPDCRDTSLELHLPSYHYCGPGTRLCERLALDHHGINALDEACREHDLAYSSASSRGKIRGAHKTLAKKAWRRLFSWDASFFERVAAIAVGATMELISLF